MQEKLHPFSFVCHSERSEESPVKQHINHHRFSVTLFLRMTKQAWKPATTRLRFALLSVVVVFHIWVIVVLVFLVVILLIVVIILLIIFVVLWIIFVIIHLYHLAIVLLPVFILKYCFIFLIFVIK